MGFGGGCGDLGLRGPESGCFFSGKHRRLGLGPRRPGKSGCSLDVRFLESWYLGGSLGRNFLGGCSGWMRIPGLGLLNGGSWGFLGVGPFGHAAGLYCLPDLAC